MSRPKKAWKKTPAKSTTLRWTAVLVFGGGFLFFLISACSKKKPVQVQNRPPELILVPNQTSPALDENQSLSFGLAAADPEGKIPVLSVAGLPKNAVFRDSSNGRGSFAWTPTFSQEGTYLLRFIASDGALADTERVMVVVGNINRPPFLMSIGDQSFVEGSAGAFSLRGIDPDGDSVFLSLDSIPSGAFFIDSLNGRGGFFWSPNFNQAGEYRPVFSVTDRQYADIQRPKLVVLEFDRAPSFFPVADQRVTEGQVLSFSISASDPDGQTVLLRHLGLPPGASFDTSNGTGTFRWQTRVLQADIFYDTAVAFVAASAALADTLAVRIKVDTARLTYINHTGAIFEGTCQPCHFPGAGGQMCQPLQGLPYCWDDYGTIFQFRERIRIRVTQGTMPPAAGLPQGKRDTINAWVLRGALQ